MSRILVVEDEAILRKNIVDRLRAEGHELFDTASAESAEQLAALLAPDLILTDLRLPGIDGMELLRRVRKISPRALLVLMTAHGSRQTALDAVRDGAYDYLTKPVELRELVLLVARACNHAKAIDRLQCAGRQQVAAGTFDQFVGVSSASRAIKRQISAVINAAELDREHPQPILITGETGTGKTLVARILHNEGPRKSAPCVVVHCGTLTTRQFETEYLGLRNDAGAMDVTPRTAEKGMLELAQGGTVFLDEVAALSPAIQDHLLALLEERSIQAGDGRIGRPTDLQFIAATSRDLGAMVKSGGFSAGLYHRLRVLELRLPPLRQRSDDIPVLARHFLVKHASRRGLAVPEVSDDMLKQLVQFDWPGNLRELGAVMERALLRCGGRAIQIDDLLIAASPADSPVVTSPGRTSTRRAGEAVCSPHPLHEYCPPADVVASGNSEELHLSIPLGRVTLEQMTQLIIRAVFHHTGGDAARTANLLEITLDDVMQCADAAPVIG